MNHLYTDGTDTVVAASVENATEIWENYADTINDESWDMIPDEKRVTILYARSDDKPYTSGAKIPSEAIIKELDEDDQINDFEFSVTATAGQWAAVNEPLFLCTKEW
jgi:hypothetical protein